MISIYTINNYELIVFWSLRL